MVLYWIVRPIVFIFYKLLYRVKIYNKQNLIKKGKCIVTCNHLGKADVMTVGYLYPNRTIFLAKKEWFVNKFISFILSCLGSIPINREKPDLHTIKAALKVLKDNKRLGIFPEGRRNFVSNNLQEIKQGTALFAVKGQAMITPVIIYEKLKPFKRNYVNIGKPLDLSEYYNVKFTEDVSKECTLKIQQALAETKSELETIVSEIKNKGGKNAR